MLSSPQTGKRLWRFFAQLTPLEQDSLLYLASAIFAVGQLLISTHADYRQWAALAVIPYALVGLIALLLSRHKRAQESRFTRRGLVVSLFLLCLVVPLSISIAQRVNNVPGIHAQDEVAVIERCGDRVVHNQNCYLNAPNTVGTGAQNLSKKTDATAFVPYLPGMIIFGVPNGLTIPKALRDARVSLTLFTLVITVVALALSRLSADDRVRLFQFVIILPTGALPLVTGGDDLPIVALLLLALVLSYRRQPVLAGIASAVAAAIKLTAWPLAFALIFVQPPNSNRHVRFRYGGALVAILAPIIAIASLINPRAFFVNEILFPLGLTKIKSPAESPLIGQKLVGIFGSQLHTLVILALVLVGGELALLLYRRLRPRSPSAMTAYVALVFFIAIMLAPATRFGYLLYPANMVVWAIIFHKFDLRLRARNSQVETLDAGLASPTT
ncbi:glycosyltransferase 87 family protein [Ferrimicrobium sp.]|uniref:glycosyltransferase 87 family protein n=1 Tax=Ferrimicrobium sp. TaxID=2926050 RepID=UPI00260739A7|nr:glycosyltransferase 87 family protein [Ferrimicrobium sp.]